MTLDVYVLTGERNLAVIERFVTAYTSTDLDEPNPCDLSVVPADYDGQTELIREEHFDAVHLDSLGAAIRYGLAEPGRAFWLYFAGKRPWFGAQMAFTLSNEITLGVSVNDPEDPVYPDPQPLEDARELMAELATMTSAHHAWIGDNEPPTFDPDRYEPWRRSLA